MRMIILLLAMAAGCGPRAVPEPPEPVSAPAAPARPPPPPPTVYVPNPPLMICVSRGGELQHVRAQYHPRTGDSTVADGFLFRSAFPLTGEYAAVAGWYVNDEPITFRGRRYTRAGEPRVLGIPEVARVGEYRGVGVYALAEDTASAARTIHLLYERGCRFQRYVAAGREDR